MNALPTGDLPNLQYINLTMALISFIKILRALKDPPHQGYLYLTQIYKKNNPYSTYDFRLILVFFYLTHRKQFLLIKETFL